MGGEGSRKKGIKNKIVEDKGKKREEVGVVLIIIILGVPEVYVASRHFIS